MTALLLNQSAFASFEAKDSSIGNAVDPSDHGDISVGFTIGITSDTEENDLERFLMPGKSSKEEEKSKKDSKQNKKQKNMTSKSSKKSSKGEKKNSKKKKKNPRCKAYEKLEADNMMQCTSPCSDDYLTCENGVDVEKPMPAGQRCYENKGVLTSQGQCVLRGAPDMVWSFDMLDACTNYPALEYCATDVEGGAPYTGLFYFSDSLNMNGTWYWKDNVIVSFGLETDDDTGEEEWKIVYRFRFGHDEQSNRTRTYIATADYGTTRVKNWRQVENVDGVEGDYNCIDDAYPDPITLFVEKVLLDNPAIFVIVDGEYQLQSVESSKYTYETTVKASELGEEYMKAKGKDPDEVVNILASSSDIMPTDRFGNKVIVTRPGLVYSNFFIFNQSDFLEDGFDFSADVQGEFNEALIPEITTILQQQREENRTCKEDFDEDWTASIEYIEASNGTLMDYIMSTNFENKTDLSVPINTRFSLMKDFKENSRSSKPIQNDDEPLRPGPGLAELCDMSTLGLTVCENIPSPTRDSNQGSNLIVKGRRNLERSMTKRRLEFSGDTWTKREYESFFPQSDEGEGGNEQTCADNETIRFTIKSNGQTKKYSCGDIAKQKPRVRFDNCGEEIVGTRMLVGINCPKTCKTCKLAQPSNSSALFDAFSGDLEPAEKQELLDKFLGTGPGLPAAKELLETFQKIDTLLRRIYGFGEGAEDGIIVVYDLLQSLEEIQPLVKDAKEQVDFLVRGAKVIGIISQIKPFIKPIVTIMTKVSKTLDAAIAKIKKIEDKTIKPTKPKVQKALQAAEKVKGAIAVTAYVSEQLFIIPMNTTRNCESVDAMAGLVNEATREATTKIFEVADDIGGFFDEVGDIIGEIQKPIQDINALFDGISSVVSSLDVLDPVVKPFQEVLDKVIDIRIPFFWCSKSVTTIVPYPCGVHLCCKDIWWVGRVCVPCGVKFCNGSITVKYPVWCDKRFVFTIRQVLDGIQGVADIIMAPINFLIDVAVRGVILLVKEVTGVDLNNLPIPGLNVDITGLEFGNLLPIGSFDDLLALPAPFDEFADPALIKKVLGAKRKKPKPNQATSKKPTAKPTTKPSYTTSTAKPTAKPTEANSTEYDAAFVIETLNKFDLFKDFNPICEPKPLLD